MTGRIYIPKGELSEDKIQDLACWVADKVPPLPEDQLCEANFCHGMFDEESERPLANGFSFRIDDSHICYSYVCESCEQHLTDADEYIAENYPEGEGGYALVPRHCS